MNNIPHPNTQFNIIFLSRKNIYTIHIHLLFYTHLRQHRHLVIHISMNSFGSLNTWASNSIWLCKIKVLKLVQAYEKGRTKQDSPYVSFEETQDNNIKNLWWSCIFCSLTDGDSTDYIPSTILSVGLQDEQDYTTQIFRSLQSSGRNWWA